MANPNIHVLIHVLNTATRKPRTGDTIAMIDDLRRHGGLPASRLDEDFFSTIAGYEREIVAAMLVPDNLLRPAHHLRSAR